MQLGGFPEASAPEEYGAVEEIRGQVHVVVVAVAVVAVVAVARRWVHYLALLAMRAEGRWAL